MSEEIRDENVEEVVEETTTETPAEESVATEVIENAIETAAEEVTEEPVPQTPPAPDYDARFTAIEQSLAGIISRLSEITEAGFVLNDNSVGVEPVEEESEVDALNNAFFARQARKLNNLY